MLTRGIHNIKRHLVKFIIRLHSHSFTVNDRKISYLFLPAKSKVNRDKMIVVFSAFASEGNRAGYNFVRTLFNNRENKLFILDDFGFERRGSYYLGENGNFFVADLVEQLVTYVMERYKIKTMCFCGSSKGGWAALYFGLKMNVDMIISGSPQYYIGSYLSTNEKHLNILGGIMGDDGTLASSQSYLNSLLENQICKGHRKSRIYLHYSINEVSYNNDVKFLIGKLKEHDYNLIEDVASYSKHLEVADYFPSYLQKVLKNDFSLVK